MINNDKKIYSSRGAKRRVRKINKREIRQAVTDTVKNIIVIAAVIVLLTNLLVSVQSVNKNNMTPLLNERDIIVAVRVIGVKPGDIVSFYYNNKILLKRVIAKAGDWVDIDENGNVYVNDLLLDEPYVSDEEKSLGNCDIDMPYQVPDGCIFVMGDDRIKSADSRLKEIGAIRTENIIGRVLFKIWPLNELNYYG